MSLEIPKNFRQEEEQISTDSEELFEKHKISKKNIEVDFEENFNSDIEIIDSNLNIDGNYGEYVGMVLSSIKQIKKKNIKHNLNKVTLENIDLNKKILLIDLDETLIHSELENKNKNEYDNIIKIKSDKKETSYGVFIRPGTINFLEKMSQYFNIGIFTASEKIYADEIIKCLDPENKFIKFRLYRENCLKINDILYIKDLKVLKNIDLKNVILLDNNMYSFANNLTNGILIDSFFNNKNDTKIEQLEEYLIKVISQVDDVREINESIFHFNEIYENIEI